MEDKVFELLEKMYTDLKSEMKSVKNELKNDIQNVGNQVAKLENDLVPKIEILFDGYRQLSEGQEEIKSQLADISTKLENQGAQINFLKGSKIAAQ